MAERQALGRGLSALISRPERAPGETRAIPLDEIHKNVLQPRKRFVDAAIAELAASIREKGVLQPIVVRRAAQGGYEIIVGERRWRAAREAGMDAIPAIVREASDRESLELALVENIQREDLNPIEQAQAFRALMELNGLTQEDLATRVGKDRTTITNVLRLLALPPEIQEDLSEGRLTMGHGRALLGCANAAHQRALRDRILRQGLSVREVERLALEGPDGGARRTRARATGDSTLKALEADLQSRFQTPVTLRRRGKRGTIEIKFYNDEDLDRIVRLILG
ncbi:MAG: ParB/RepB/Spo0J family partition protein [Deltaproteobacteria bacterium]|nr:ParB/RepB/Spo0J family partition protein [Deltaproteobacteria bacterium]